MGLCEARRVLKGESHRDESSYIQVRESKLLLYKLNFYSFALEVGIYGAEDKECSLKNMYLFATLVSLSGPYKWSARWEKCCRLGSVNVRDKILIFYL